MKSNQGKIKKILVVNLGGIGDVLLSSPSLKALRGLYPDADVSLLAATRARAVPRIIAHLDIDRVFTFDMGYGGNIPCVKMFLNLMLLLRLRLAHFDLAVNMRTLTSDRSARKMHALFRLIHPGKSAGRDTEGRGHFFDIKIPEPAVGSRFEMEYDIDTVRALGGEVEDRSIAFTIDKRDVDNVRTLLQRSGICDDDIVIGIHPGGAPSHRWGIDNFSRVVNALSAGGRCRFAVTGGSNEVALGEELGNRTDARITNLAGQLDLAELCAFIKRCRLYITNDTGPMHIAAALGTPLVAVFGPGYFDRYDPRHLSDKVSVFYRRRECAPCDRIECAAMECLRSISPDEVAEAALTMLDTHASVAVKS